MKKNIENYWKRVPYFAVVNILVCKFLFIFQIIFLFQMARNGIAG